MKDAGARCAQIRKFIKQFFLISCHEVEAGADLEGGGGGGGGGGWTPLPLRN